jgi:hypothetical protein
VITDDQRRQLFAIARENWDRMRLASVTGIDAEYEQHAVELIVGKVLDAVVPLRSELSVDQSTPYRLSPNGTLAGRTNPGWRVLVSKDPHLHWGQDLTDQHVAAWSPLIRKGGSNVG